MAADLKISISGIREHGQAGYGGGAKAILPGVSSVETIAFNHNDVARENEGSGPFRVFKNPVREDMIEAARLAGLDFSINILYNGERKPTHVFAGDLVAAHQAACRVAIKHYATPPFNDADIVVANTYPWGWEPGVGQGWIARSVREGGIGVAIMQHPWGHRLTHYVGQRGGNKVFREGYDAPMLAAARRGTAPASAGRGAGGARGGRGGGPGRRNYELVVYSQYMDREQSKGFPQGTIVCDKWADVIATLQKKHKGDARVALYPYGATQHQVAELDG
jgi:hypothetical protein